MATSTTITYDSDSCAIGCQHGTGLTELAFALEFACNNFVGRGIYRMAVERPARGNKFSQAFVKSLMPDEFRPMLVSQTILLGDAVKQGVILSDIPIKNSFRFGIENMTEIVKSLGDGQTRFGTARLFSSNVSGWAETIIESKDISPDQQMSIYSYGFADMVVGLFALGVRDIKYQITQKTCQLYIKHKLPDAKLIDFFRQEGSAYPVNMLVEKLP